MKRFLGVLLLAVMIHLPLGAGDFEDPGLISGWGFAPLQVDVGLVSHKKLVDEGSDTIISLGLFLLEQRSAILSCSFVANRLQKNYGIQLPPLILGVLTDTNYGLSLGWQNYSKKCYGIQMGVLNNSWGGDPIEENRKRVQILGMNIADTVYLGLINISNKIQIGVFNFSPGAIFQLGFLNYNKRSYLPWLPLLNFDMGRK